MIRNLYARSYWFGNGVLNPLRYFKLGDLLIRYASNVVQLDAAAIDASLGTKKKGSSTFDKVQARIPLVAVDESGKPYFVFTARAAAHKPVAVGVDVEFMQANAQMSASGTAWNRITIQTINAQLSGATTAKDGDSVNTFYAGSPCILAGPMMMGDWNPPTPVSVTRTSAALMRARFPGTTMTVADSWINNTRLATDLAYAMNGLTSGFGGSSGGPRGAPHNMTANQMITPRAAAARATLGVSYLQQRGEFLLPLARFPELIEGAWLNGVHKAIQAVVPTATTLSSTPTPEGGGIDVDWIYATFSKADVAAILRGHKATVSAEDAAKLEQLATQVTNLGAVEIRLLVAKEPVGPMSVMGCKAVLKAKSEGASDGDILNADVSGRKVSAWDAEALKEKPVRAILWFTKLEALPTPVTPVYLLPNLGAIQPMPFDLRPTPLPGSVVTIDAQTFAGAAASAGHGGNGVTLKASLEARYGCEILLLTDDDSNKGSSIMREVSTAEDAEPWTDLPMIWWKRLSTKTMQPVANALAMALCETAAAFPET